MSKRYEPQDIEKKWQKIWQDEKAAEGPEGGSLRRVGRCEYASKYA